jgi:hypothetical protein
MQAADVDGAVERAPQPAELEQIGGDEGDRQLALARPLLRPRNRHLRRIDAADGVAARGQKQRLLADAAADVEHLAPDQPRHLQVIDGTLRPSHVPRRHWLRRLHAHWMRLVCDRLQYVP